MFLYAHKVANSEKLVLSMCTLHAGLFSLSQQIEYFIEEYSIYTHTHTRYKDTNSLEQPPKLNILLNVLQRKSTIKNIKKARIQTTKPIILTKTKNFVEQKQCKNETKGKRLALN